MPYQKTSGKRIWTWIFRSLVLAMLVGGAIAFGRHDVMADWRTASREPIGVAPDPAAHRAAVLQVYAARAFSWRGVFGVHTWIAAKPTGADAYTIYEVIGWRLYRDDTSVVISQRPPDARWFGAEPEILADLRGGKAGSGGKDGHGQDRAGHDVDDMIRRIHAAALEYPHAGEYRVWPGPNSNTFIAHLAREVPELALDLPPTAIGKDFIPEGGIAAKTPSGTGIQLSLFGVLGILGGLEEGIEINILGLTFGIDPLDLSLKLPLAGRIGPSPAAEPHSGGG